ncbi:glyoxalase [Streptomyces sp. 8N706]|uniref:glyoxalase n=1 Tax=Streptomyces sp. 8N706 TaxID=3457416 RepID=UPI003FD52F8B
MLSAIDHGRSAAPPGSRDVLRAFSSGGLGMTEAPRPPVQLHPGPEADVRRARTADPDPRVVDTDASGARLAAAGAPVARDEVLPGRRRFSSEDPVGNRLEFPEAG